jgi:hypothetical protein
LQNFGEQIQELTFLQQEAKENQDTQNARQYTEIVDTYKKERKKLEQIRDALSLMGRRRAEINTYTV